MLVHFYGDTDKAACGLRLEGRDWAINWRAVTCRECVRWGWVGARLAALRRQWN